MELTERQIEINEFNAMLAALAKKYNVSLSISIIDLTIKPEVKEAKVVE